MFAIGEINKNIIVIIILINKHHHTIRFHFYQCLRRITLHLKETKEKKKAYFLYCYRVHDAYNQGSSIYFVCEREIILLSTMMIMMAIMMTMVIIRICRGLSLFLFFPFFTLLIYYLTVSLRINIQLPHIT